MPRGRISKVFHKIRLGIDVAAMQMRRKIGAMIKQGLPVHAQAHMILGCMVLMVRCRTQSLQILREDFRSASRAEEIRV
jgi:hypothetical protein